MIASEMCIGTLYVHNERIYSFQGSVDQMGQRLCTCIGSIIGGVPFFLGDRESMYEEWLAEDSIVREMTIMTVEQPALSW